MARFLASAEALRRPDGRSKRTGSLNALRSSLRGFFQYLERAGLVEQESRPHPPHGPRGSNSADGAAARGGAVTARCPRRSDDRRGPTRTRALRVPARNAPPHILPIRGGSKAGPPESAGYAGRPLTEYL